MVMGCVVVVVVVGWLVVVGLVVVIVVDRMVVVSILAALVMDSRAVVEVCFVEVVAGSVVDLGGVPVFISVIELVTVVSCTSMVGVVIEVYGIDVFTSPVIGLCALEIESVVAVVMGVSISVVVRLMSNSAVVVVLLDGDVEEIDFLVFRDSVVAVAVV